MAIREGSSLDVYELDAASNNGVDAIRDLVSKTALATPGRWKVYIIDEIHMLSTSASNALLKTLEEPPAHVIFVLATTDPQKVIPTIRSRTQHYEFRLISPESLENLLNEVSNRAEISLPTGAILAATKKGRGSARDALSALEQIAIVGQVEDDDGYVESIVEALASRDSAQAMIEVARAVSSGLDPAQLAVEIADYLRQGFLASLAPQLVSLSGSDLERCSNVLREMGLPALVRTMELLGETLVYMRDSLDSRVQLESVLMKSCMLPAGDSYADLVERIDRLERQVGSGLRSPAAESEHIRPIRNEQRGSDDRGSDDRGSNDRGSDGYHGKDSAKSQGGNGDDGSDRSSAGYSDSSKGSDAGNEVTPSGQTLGASKRTSPGQALGAFKRTSSAGMPSVGISSVGILPEDASLVDVSSAGREDREDVDSRSAKDDSSAGEIGGGEAASPATAPATVSDKVGEREFNRDLLTMAWGDVILSTLSPRAKSRYAPSRFVAVDGRTAVMALPNDTYLQGCKQNSKEVEDAISSYFGVPVTIELIVESTKEVESPAADSSANLLNKSSIDKLYKDRSSTDAPSVGGSFPEQSLRANDLSEADHIAPSRRPAEEHIREAFPGVEEL
jgi:DNA polymerase-3 subunit gamma/tau